MQYPIDSLRMSSRRTIIYIGGFELPDKNAAAQRVLANGKLFRDLGFEVVLIGVDQGLASDNPLADTETTYLGFTIFSVPKPKTKLQWLNHLTRVKSLASLVEDRYSNTLAMVVCYNYPAVALWNIRRMCQKHGARFVPDVTEWYSSAGKGFIFGVLKWADTALRMHVMNYLSHGMITTSSLITKKYRKINGFPVVELPTLFDKDVFPRSDFIKSVANVLRLIYIGNAAFVLEHVKKDRSNIKDRLDLVIKLVFALNQSGIAVHLDVYGLNEGDYLKIYPEHSCLILQDPPLVQFHGQKPHKVIIRAIRNSDLSIFFRSPSRVTESGFPTKLSESITCGTPVITNRLRNQENYVGTTGIYFVDPSNIKDAVDHLTILLQTECHDIDAVKRRCDRDAPFDYRNYMPMVEKFVIDLGVVEQPANGHSCV
jgi:glycosyltransferase involved in cell wall biosynthesis